MSDLIITQHDGWAQLQVNREAQRNAMNRATRQGLLNAFESLKGTAKAIDIQERHAQALIALALKVKTRKN
jgi:enoyl-CoA hydratase/carnithine racemase